MPVITRNMSKNNATPEVNLLKDVTPIRKCAKDIIYCDKNSVTTITEKIVNKETNDYEQKFFETEQKFINDMKDMLTNFDIIKQSANATISTKQEQCLKSIEVFKRCNRELPELLKRNPVRWTNFAFTVYNKATEFLEHTSSAKINPETFNILLEESIKAQEYLTEFILNLEMLKTFDSRVLARDTISYAKALNRILNERAKIRFPIELKDKPIDEDEEKEITDHIQKINDSLKLAEELRNNRGFREIKYQYVKNQIMYQYLEALYIINNDLSPHFYTHLNNPNHKIYDFIYNNYLPILNIMKEFEVNNINPFFDKNTDIFIVFSREIKCARQHFENYFVNLTQQSSPGVIEKKIYEDIKQRKEIKKKFNTQPEVKVIPQQTKSIKKNINDIPVDPVYSRNVNEEATVIISVKEFEEMKAKLAEKETIKTNKIQYNKEEVSESDEEDMDSSSDYEDTNTKRARYIKNKK